MKKNYEKNLKTKSGWTKIPNAIRHDEKLTSDAKVVIEELLSISGEYNISMKGISKATHLSESKVKRAVELLQDTGYLQIEKIRNGKYFGGYKWMISDISGVYRKCTDEISMDDISNSALSNYGISNDDISIPATPIDAPLYQYTERYQQTNNEEQKDKLTEWSERPHHQPDVVEDAEILPPYNPSSFTDSSSEANASPLQGKIQGGSEQVISPFEYMFRQLREKYPPHRLGDYAAGLKAFQSIPDINMVYPEIIQGLENWKQSESWSNEDGRYVPGLAKFLNERKWKTPPIWNNNAGGTNDYANSDTRKAVSQKWHQLETRNNTTIGEGE